MIFKVYFQEKMSEVAVRENTKTVYVTTNLRRTIVKRLKKSSINMYLL
ncbi:RNA polymerase epsilon subunit [Priestia megaterium]|nr:RNA polymerase epsilon subunit [Priestia megaterium]PNE05037.1 hypothetical protein C1Y47_22900 [Priestia megaterium]